MKLVVLALAASAKAKPRADPERAECEGGYQGPWLRLRGGLIRDIDDLRLREFFHALDPGFTPDPGLLRAAVRRVIWHVEVLVDPDRTRLNTQGDLQAAIGIVGPDRPAEAELAAVDALDHFIDRVIGEHGDDRPELLLADKRGIVGKIADDRRLNEIALSRQRASACDHPALTARAFDEAEHLFVLQPVLDRPDLSSLIETVIDHSLACQVAEFIT